MALDSVRASCAESRGINVVHGRQYDGVLVLGILRVAKGPAEVFGHAATALAERGTLVATSPPFYSILSPWHRLRHRCGFRGCRGFSCSGVHPIGTRLARFRFRDAGLSFEPISSKIPTEAPLWSSGKDSREILCVGTHICGPARSGERAVVQSAKRQSETESELNSVSDRNPGS
jgi:hypothetical protein